MSPISSRKIVPPLAISNLPILRACAPVKAPFSEPNNSFSSSSPGMAAQLIVMYGPSLRSDRLWIARANSSLPVPDSPCSRTEASLLATFVDQLPQFDHLGVLPDDVLDPVLAEEFLAQQRIFGDAGGGFRAPGRPARRDARCRTAW